MRKKDNNLNRGQVRRSPRLRASATPASIQSVCANNRPRCVYYLLSHLCRSLSAVLVRHPRHVALLPFCYNCDSRLPSCDFTAAGAKSRSQSDWERKIRQQCAVGRALAAVMRRGKKKRRHIAPRDKRAHIERVMSTHARVR